MTPPIQAVLFDLDGTLLDTVPDLASVLNTLLVEHGEKPQPLSQIRNVISQGSRALRGFFPSLTEAQTEGLLADYLNRYEYSGFESTQLFSGGAALLKKLHEANIPWGIVTNKLARHSEPLLKKFDWFSDCRCLISGDTLAHAKPHPLPVQTACKQLGFAPENCLMLGDDLNDVLAGRGAQTQTGVLLHGYIHTERDPYAWNANYYFSDFGALLADFERLFIIG